ncbi:MAG: NnrU family protein [Anaerolineae bacterium]|nr:NnrU family protein [Anaerolineae bacterium]
MVIILLWMLVFAVVHSITADRRFKQVIINLMGERPYEGFYRLFYNALSVIMLAPLFPYMWSISETLYQVSQPIATIFRVIQLIGMIGLAVSILQIDFLRFAGLRQVIMLINGGQLPLADENLQTGGLYGWVRHPLYFFSLLVLWFSPSMTNASLVFNIAATLYFVFGSLIEERSMVNAYGDIYKQYQQNVSWMIPLPPSKS